MTSTQHERAHSEDVLTDLRDGWFNADYLDLVATRLNLQSLRRALDVGCGQSHWGLPWLQRLGQSAHLTGVDIEMRWANDSARRASALGLGERTDFVTGAADALPFEDAAFDFVTCQTLLMHVADPQRVLKEMLRVLEPGGVLLVSEPNNVAQQMAADSVNRALEPRTLARVFQLFTTCSRGRALLGRGDDCIADVLPMYLGDLGLPLEMAAQNENVHPVQVPYDDEQRALLNESLTHEDNNFWLWDRDDAQRLFLAADPDSNEFNACYEAFLTRNAVCREQVQRNIFQGANGTLHYLFAVRKPV